MWGIFHHPNAKDALVYTFEILLLLVKEFTSNCAIKEVTAL
jgi:hypothetical protein